MWEIDQTLVRCGNVSRFTQFTFHSNYISPNNVSPKLHLLKSFTPPKKNLANFILNFIKFIIELIKVVYIRTQLIFYSIPLVVQTWTPWWSWDRRFGVQPKICHPGWPTTFSSKSVWVGMSDCNQLLKLGPGQTILRFDHLCN